MPDKKLNEVFADIADAIREKTGSEGKITPLEMAEEIGNIPTGPSEEGLYYVNEDQDVIPFNLFRGVLYRYEGGSDFYSEGVEVGLCYFNTSYTPYLTSVNVNVGSTYIYDGGSSFTPFESPTEDGVYLRDDGQWSTVDNGLYFVTYGGIEAAKDSDSFMPIYDQGGCYEYDPSSSVFHRLMQDGYHMNYLVQGELLWVDSPQEFKTIISLNDAQVGDSVTKEIPDANGNTHRVQVTILS